MATLYITQVIQQKIKFCLQGITHMNLLKTSAQAEIEIRVINATYIALIGKKQKKKCHYRYHPWCLSLSEPPTWSNES
jgi:hypothetical protein